MNKFDPYTIISLMGFSIPFYRKELRVIRFVAYLRGGLLSFMIFSTRTAIFISLITYALSGNWLTAQKAFVITAYYNIIRQTMCVFFPQGVGQFAETLVSIRRIQTFMMYDEAELLALPSSGVINPGLIVTEDCPKESKIVKDSSASDGSVICKEITAKWDTTAPENTLDGVNLSVEPGSLVAVIGRVGAGKSSLIQAILKEFPLTSGSITVSGDVSYASQEPWLFSASVRQNILFGLPMDRIRYKEVVQKCALERDFSLFEFGDKTIVGERGASLSGGQRARISLARACYREAAIYLLDDPLSAVDSHVGRHLFDQCMRTFLRGKTVILVTHQLQFLQSADQIIIMDKGRVVDSGTYNSLKESGLDFAKMLTKNAEESDDEEEEIGDKVSRSGSKRGSGRSRKTSTSSAESTDEEVQASPKQVEEQRKEGSIAWDVYTKYVGAMGGICAFFWVAFFFLTTQGAASGGDYFLTYWTNKEDALGVQQQANETTTEIEDSRYTDIYIFTGLIVGTIIVTLIRSFMFFGVSLFFKPVSSMN